MSSAGGISLALFGIMIAIGSLGGWFYFAFHCSVLGLNQIGSNRSSTSIGSCLAFYTASQIRDQGLASYPPPIFYDSFIMGLVLIVCGTFLLAARKG